MVLFFKNGVLMDLVLWRHAHAEEGLAAGGGKASSISDLDRSLTEKGYRQAKKVSRWMEKKLPQNFRILASPSLRTIQTAKCLGRKVEVLNLLYQGSSRQILEYLAWPELQSPTVIVGHQPTIGRIASLILTGEEFPLAVETGDLWWFRWKEGFSGGHPVLVCVISPGLLKKSFWEKEKSVE